MSNAVRSFDHKAGSPRPFLDDKSRLNPSAGMSNKRLVLNARGVKYEVMFGALCRHPETRLGRLAIQISCLSTNTLEDASVAELCDDYDLKSSEFFFNRNAEVLDAVLAWYNDGHLHCKTNMCVKMVSRELKYWGLSTYQIDDCCQLKYRAEKENLKDELNMKRKVIYDFYYREDFGCILPSIRAFIWNIIDKPVDLEVYKLMNKTDFGESDDEADENEDEMDTGKRPKRRYCVGLRDFVESFADRPTVHYIGTVYTMIYYVLILMSLLNPILNTLPSVKDSTANSVFYYMELCCVIVFTVEFCVRFLVCPNKPGFFFELFNYVDLSFILPYYLYLALPNESAVVSVKNISAMLRCLLLLKFLRRSKSLNMLVDTFKQSIKELGIYLFYVMIGVLLFGSIVYYFEQNYTQNSLFITMPQSFWWALITLTTVGYGDIFPLSVGGKIFGGMAAITGVLLISMPISLIATNFLNAYTSSVKNSRILKIHLGRKAINRSSSKEEAR